VEKPLHFSCKSGEQACGQPGYVSVDIHIPPLVITMLRVVFGFLPFLKPENPRKIADKFSPKKLVEKVKQKYRDLPRQGAGGRTEGQHWRDKMNESAQWYELRADMLWGRPSLRERHRSAWLYATAGELYDLAELKDKASLMFQFAAHGFREVDSLSQSINYFKRSAGLASPEWANRCYTRAYGIAQITGDRQAAEECKRQIENLSPPLLSTKAPPEISN
jgi:hypothetical protein